MVSNNWETDYARKVEKYALLGIPEYWIVDYQQKQYRLKDPIVSPSLPSLKLCLNDI